MVIEGATLCVDVHTDKGDAHVKLTVDGLILNCVAPELLEEYLLSELRIAIAGVAHKVNEVR